MDFESGSSLPVSVEDNEEIRTTSLLGNSGEDKVHNNGSCEAQDNDDRELVSDVKEKGTEALESVSSLHSEKESEASSFPSPTMMRKGYGLKKWKRIKRDARKVGESSKDTGKMAIEEFPNSVMNPSKRAQVYAEREQEPESSVSSRNPIVGNLDGFDLFGDSKPVVGPSMDGGTDSENRRSKSPTAAIVPKVKDDMLVVVGYPHDKSRMRNLSGKKMAQNGGIDAIKKAREERVKNEKEIPCSSMESDSCSSNYVFMQDPYATTNGIQSERAVHKDGENVDEVQGGRENEGGYVDISPQDVNADLSRKDKKEKRENDGSSSDHDPLVVSILLLQTVQEALENEVLNFKEISEDISVDDSVSDTQPEITDVEKNLKQTNSEEFSSGDGRQKFSQAIHPEMVELAMIDLERELADLFMKRIEDEVEYLALLRTVRKLTLDQITCSEEHKTHISEKKTIALKKEAEKLENCYEGIASSDETMKLRKKVRKHTTYFFVQLLLVMLGVFLFQLSPNYVDVVPT